MLTHEIKTQRLNEAKTKAALRIDAFYPTYKQLNIERQAPRYNGQGQKTGNYGLLERQAMWDFIDAVRARSNVFDTQINAATSENELPTVDYSDISP